MCGVNASASIKLQEQEPNKQEESWVHGVKIGASTNKWHDLDSIYIFFFSDSAAAFHSALQY